MLTHSLPLKIIASTQNKVSKTVIVGGELAVAEFLTSLCSLNDSFVLWKAVRNFVEVGASLDDHISLEASELLLFLGCKLLCAILALILLLLLGKLCSEGSLALGSLLLRVHKLKLLEDLLLLLIELLDLSLHSLDSLVHGSCSWDEQIDSEGI